MKAKSIICFTLLLACTCIYAFRLAEDPFEELLKKLAIYNEEHAQEKVHLHLDKPYYAIGDNIWFKAYVIETYTNKPSKISNTLYVELINEEDSVKKELKLMLTSGITWGDFKLTDSLHAGIYRIRAYTQWMRNAGPDYFYDKTIMIGSSAAETGTMGKAVKRADEKNTSEKIAVQLFPEGGNLVENLPSKIGIKAINKKGMGEEISGSIIDNAGTEILNFKTNALGMGNFLLTPQPEKKYTARIKLKDGTVITTAVPTALTSGYVLTVNNTDSSKITARVYLSKDLVGPGEIKLVIQHNNIVYNVLKTNTEKQIVSFSLPKKDMPAGVLHFTLFTPANLPVAERLVYLNNPNILLNTSLNNLKPKYGKREKATVEILGSDDLKPSAGSFSVSVTNTSVVTPDADNESNILTSLLLTSDLQGYIEKPNYYLRDGEVRVAELDNLMLTQGWSRFVWKELAATKPKAPEFLPELTPSISGTVTTNGKKPVVKGKISLVSTSGGFFKIDTLTDDNGHFAFKDLAFSDSTKFLVQARTAKNSKYVQVKLDIPSAQIVTKNKNTGDIPVNVNEAIQNYVQQSKGYFDTQNKIALQNGALQLKEVAIVTKKKSAKYGNELVFGKADQILTTKDLNPNFNLVSSLANRLIGVTYKDGNFYATQRFSRSPKLLKIYYNGLEVQVPFVATIIPQDVISVDVLISPGLITASGQVYDGGSIVITAKEGSESMMGHHGMVTYSPKGYNIVREFYSPQYTPDHKETGEDERTTVYWNPNVITDANGTGKFSYYNTDQPGTYRVVIEGINDAGHLARKVYTYDVQ